VRQQINVLVLGLAMLFSTAGADYTPIDTVTATELPRADAVLVRKGERRLFLLRDGEPFREYRIALGGNPKGHKQEEGDLRTPEGEYFIDWRNPNSDFYLSLRISYPNQDDLARAAARGASPGGAIMIHGQRNGEEWFENFQQLRDWTEGCIAVTNAAMEEIWQAVPNGTPIRIEP
jgi:murein L,D-transpeptidase YafK